MHYRLTAVLIATLTALTLAIPASASATSTDTARVQRAVARFNARAEKGLGRVVLTRDPETGATIAADFEYACNPSFTTWNTKAAWGSGTVLEDRGCLREDDAGNVRFYLYARTRRGGTAILSDWDFYDTSGGTHNVRSWVHSYTTDKDYGWKDCCSNPHFNDIFGESFVQVANIPDCSQVAGNDYYAGFILAYQANPYGADEKSGEKDEASVAVTNSFLDCGHQS